MLRKHSLRYHGVVSETELVADCILVDSMMVMILHLPFKPRKIAVKFSLDTVECADEADPPQGK